MYGRLLLNKTKKIYALKEMSKIKLIKKKSVHCIMNERNLLAMVKHPFIINMHYAFEDREKLYIITDLIIGGDLRYHMRQKKKKFNEIELKFIIAWVVAALEYIHTKGIIHRDIKPENILFDENGYICITDFGISAIWNEENWNESSGTPGYMAPEVMSKQNHGIAVDYYALGIIWYEIIMGKRPYSGKDRKEIKDVVMKKQFSISKSEIPKGWSLSAIDFVNQWIQRKPLNRLGFNGPEEVKEHSFLKDVNWRDLVNKNTKPPFKPKPKKALYLNPLSTTEEEKLNKEKQEEDILLKRNSVQNLFNGYHYDIELEYKDLIEKDTENRKLNENMKKIIKAQFPDSGNSTDRTPKTIEVSQILAADC